MNVKKSVLEQKSNEELEKYISQDSRFVPQAKIYAYEILKSRGRKFRMEEVERITSVFEKEKVTIHPHHKKTAYLIYLSGSLGIIFFFLTYNTFINNSLDIFIGITSITFVFGVGYRVNKGNTDKIKYLLLILFILGIIASIPSMKLMLFFLLNPLFDTLTYFSIIIIYCIQIILQIWAMVLLFKIQKNN